LNSSVCETAKNAGTSVDQIERFYAGTLPLSKEMAIKLQSFGSSDARDIR
jgi:plasmid maintenance system antidote protein VapI